MFIRMLVRGISGLMSDGDVNASDLWLYTSSRNTSLPGSTILRTELSITGPFRSSTS